MRKALLVGSALLCGGLAHATSFSVAGNWIGTGGLSYACSDSGSISASCSAVAPGEDFPGGSTGGSSVRVSEGIIDPRLVGGSLAVQGSIDLWAAGSGDHPAPYQPKATISGSIDLPSEWQNVSVYSVIRDTTDQYSGGQTSLMPVQLHGSNGQTISAGNIYEGYYLSDQDLAGVFTHTAGTPFSVSWSQSLSCCGIADSTDEYSFQLIFVDPPSDPVSDTPEPGAYFLLGAGLLVLLPFVRRPVSA